MSNYNLSPEDVRKRLEERIARQDRGIFTDILADAIDAKPSKEAWHKMAEHNPERYVRSISNMAQVNGFTQKTEHIEKRLDLNDLANMLLTRYGPETAQEMLALHNLPANLINPKEDE